MLLLNASLLVAQSRARLSIFLSCVNCRWIVCSSSKCKVPHGSHGHGDVVEPGDGEHVGDGRHAPPRLPHQLRRHPVQQQLGRGQLPRAQLVLQLHHLEQSGQRDIVKFQCSAKAPARTFYLFKAPTSAMLSQLKIYQDILLNGR